MRSAARDGLAHMVPRYSDGRTRCGHLALQPMVVTHDAGARGYGIAQWVALHGAAPEGLGVRESLSVWLSRLGMTLANLVYRMWPGGVGLVVLSRYPAQVIRLALSGKRSAGENSLRAASFVAGRFAEMASQVKFALNRLRRVHSALIQYQAPTVADVR